MLPRLMEVARINFGNSEGKYVAAIYSAGIMIATIVSVLSSNINRLLKNVKTYFLITFIFDLIGIVLFAIIDNFALNMLAYFAVCFADGLCGMLIYFYIAGFEDSQRKDSFLIKCRSALNVGQSIGIIVGGVFGSILKYRTVLLIASAIVTISTIMLITTNKKEYKKTIIIKKQDDDDNEKIDFKEIFNKKQSFLFVLLIATPLAFYDVYLDYKFPVDIINLGLTTAVISFVSMSGRLISAYASVFTYRQLKYRIGLSKMTYVYLLGCFALMMIYQFNASIIMIIIVTAAMGVLDSFGTLSCRERFIEITHDENISEDDSNVILKVGDKLGTSVGPSLISFVGNAVVLPIVMLCSCVLYKLLSKKR